MGHAFFETKQTDFYAEIYTRFFLGGVDDGGGSGVGAELPVL